MTDEGLHELRLNGKQMVFLFMIATVVAVVTFLCGVMVGRGVPAAQASELVATADGSVDPTANRGAADAPRASDGTNDRSPAPIEEDLSYFDRLESPDAPPERFKDAATLDREEAAATAGRVATPAAPDPTAERPRPVTPAPATPPAPPPAASPEVSPSVPPAAAAVAGEPAGKGFVVQVAATRIRRDADTMARRLSGKGYPAFVSAAAGKQKMYRVRVGKFPERREADRVARRLQREEKFKPWVTQ